MGIGNEMWKGDEMRNAFLFKNDVTNKIILDRFHGNLPQSSTKINTM